MKAFLPRNLELREIITTNPPQFKYHEDNFKYIVSLVSEIPANNRKVLKEDGFIPLNASIIQEKIHDYKWYMDYLLDNNILECDGHYKVGVKSKGYRFSESYQTELKVEPISKRTLVKKKSTTSAYNYQMQKKYDYLFRWFNHDLTLDMNAAMDYMNEQRKLSISEDERGINNFNSSWIAAYKLADEDFFFRIDNNVGRCHTNLTNLRSDLRNFITYNGQTLVSVDVTNSQPFLSGLLLDPRFYQPKDSNSHPTLLNMFTSHWDRKFKLRTKTLLSLLSSIMLVNINQDADNQDFKPYLTAIRNGTLYEFIRDQIYHTTGRLISDRGELKEVVFTAMFTDNRFIGQLEAEPKRIFRSMFPEVYNVFGLLKRHDATVLPRILQSIEAKVILDYAAKTIGKERPEMPLFTIHDSIVCPKGNEQYVAQIIEQEMLSRVGMKPSLKYEVWSPENLRMSNRTVGMAA